MIQIVSQRYGLEGVGISMQGGRAENQDDLGCVETPLGFLIVVCDGMGGGPGGKTASSIVKTTVMDTLLNGPAISEPADLFKRAVDRAQTALEEQMAIMPQLKGMGSTLVAILISDKQATVAHLGDSRCYKLRGGKMAYRSNDHSLVGELVRGGALTEEQARKSPQSNVITRALGATDEHVAEIDELPYRRGDRFVLCTDGVWGVMTQAELLMRLTAPADVSTVAKNLSAEIDTIGDSHGGTHDNHTLAIIEMKRDSIIKEQMTTAQKTLLAIGALLLVVSVIFNIVGLSSTGSQSQQEKLKTTTDSVERANDSLSIALKAAKETYVELSEGINETGTEYQKRVISIDKKIDSLNQLIGVQQRINDSLQKVCEAQQKKLSAISPEQSKNRAEDTPEALLRQAVEELESLLTYRDRKQSSVTEKVESSKRKVCQALTGYNEKTDNRMENSINDIVSLLSGEDRRFNPNKNVIRTDDGFYEVKVETKKKVREIILQLERAYESRNGQH